MVMPSILNVSDPQFEQQMHSDPAKLKVFGCILEANVLTEYKSMHDILKEKTLLQMHEI